MTKLMLGAIASTFLLSGVVATGEDAPPVAVAEKPVPAPALTPQQIQKLVGELGAKEFATRETAMKQLSKAGVEAIPALEKAANGEDLEVTVRTIRILESILIRGSVNDFMAAEEALEKLQQSEAISVSSRATSVLGSMGEVREQRAVAAIKQLNGIVKADSRQNPFAPPQPMRAGEGPITTVVLNRRWTGKETGLKHLGKLRSLQTVYLVEGVVSPEAITNLERKLPNVQVQMRGGACLGVAGFGMERGCQISLVNPNSAADKAGLMPDDIIVAFDGKAGKEKDTPLDFDRLVELIKEHDAGDTVPVTVSRRGKETTVKVTLHEWK